VSKQLVNANGLSRASAWVGARPPRLSRHAFHGRRNGTRTFPAEKPCRVGHSVPPAPQALIGTHRQMSSMSMSDQPLRRWMPVAVQLAGSAAGQRENRHQRQGCGNRRFSAHSLAVTDNVGASVRPAGRQHARQRLVKPVSLWKTARGSNANGDPGA
jgi:hypothetical protein